LEGRLVQVVADWFESERTRHGRTRIIGIANGALVLLEYFRATYPLRPEDYTSRGGTQVKGLSGRRGTDIIRRFRPGAPSIGTEAGRTSRGTIPAIRQLAGRLNDLEDELGSLGAEDRGRLADAMQRWVVENPFAEYFERQKLQPALDVRQTSVFNIAMILSAAQRRNQAGPVAQHLVGAKLALRFPDRDIDNYGYSTADLQLNRPGDFVVADTAFHVTVTPSSGVMDRCRGNVAQGYRTVLLVPESKREGARQMAESEGLSDKVAVLGIEAFVGQNLEEIAGFGQTQFESDLRRLLETYNDRVRRAETDPSLLIEIPDNLARGNQ
jgi:hypothetical protein